MVDNPFRRALLVIAVLGGLTTIVLFAIAVWPVDQYTNIYDPTFPVDAVLSRGAVLIASAAFFWLSVPALLLWLYFSAKHWTPAEKAD